MCHRRKKRAAGPYRDKSAAGILMFSDGERRVLYRPYAGLAAARIAARALSVVLIPACEVNLRHSVLKPIHCVLARLPDQESFRGCIRTRLWRGEREVNTYLGNRDGLLLHHLMNGGAISLFHLV